MVGKILSGLFCLLLLYSGVMPFFSGFDYYDSTAPQDVAVTALTNPSHIARAESYAKLMQAQDLEGLKRETDPSVFNADYLKVIPEIAKYSSSEKPLSTRVISYNFSTFKNYTNNTQWTKSWIIIAHYYKGYQIFTTTYFLKENGHEKVNGFNITKLTQKDIEGIRFSIIDQPAINYVVLAVGALILIFSLVTLFVCLTDKELKQKWLWVIFVLIGIFRFNFNWANQTLGFNLMEGRFPQASMSQNLFEPAQIYFLLPIGAVFYWFNRVNRKSKTVIVKPMDLDTSAL